jgi:hypothetical protein
MGTTNNFSSAGGITSQLTSTREKKSALKSKNINNFSKIKLAIFFIIREIWTDSTVLMGNGFVQTR